MAGFDNPWYAEIIERFTCDTSEGCRNDATDAHGRAILAAACVIAQAIDGLAEAVRGVSSPETP